MSGTDSAVVLVVEDEPDVAETYEMWLVGDYEVRLAGSGQAALEELDEDVDVVLLDRMMPGMSGDEVLEKIREQDYDVRVTVVSAVDPDFDIIEMGFDDYLTKPPTRETLCETVEDLLGRRELTESVQEYQSLLAKRATLEAEKSNDALAESEAYAKLEAQIDAAKRELESEEDRFLDDAEFVGALRELDDESAVEEVDE